MTTKLTRWNTNTAALLAFLVGALDQVESALIAVVAKVAPWLAPLPTAYLVLARTVEHFRWPWQVGLAAAAVVEALGLVITLTGLELYGYNRTRRKTDPAAPLALPVALLAVYLVAAELLTVGLDVVPKWGSLTLVDWTPAVFPVLSVAGMAVIAVRLDHRQRLAAIAEDKAEARRQRIERRNAPQMREEHAGNAPDAPQEVRFVRCGYAGCDWTAPWPSARYADEQSARAARSGHMRFCAHRNGKVHEPVVLEQVTE